MADAFELDFSDLTKLAADIDAAGRDVGSFARKAVEVTSRNVRDSWRDRLKGSPMVPGGPSTVSYDLVGGVGVRSAEIGAEIGPERGRRQSTIVGILEVGSATGATPRNFGVAALHDNQADFEFGIRRAVSDALEQNGL